MKKMLTLLLFGLFILACTSQKSTEEVNKELYNQVMDVHDEVMPKMEAFYSMRKMLREKIAAADSLGLDSAQLQANLLLIDSAERSMMDWMHEFRSEDYEGEELTEYLKSELVKVNEMKEIMLRALSLRDEIEK
jgi:hypothetical protein